MKNTTLFLLACSLFSFTFAQNKSEISINGNILDMYDCPASFAWINISQNDSIVNQGFADEKGNFSICLDNKGTYDLSIYAPKLQSSIMGILVISEREMETISLNPYRRMCYLQYYEFNNPPLFEKETPSGLTLDASELRNMGLGK